MICARGLFAYGLIFDAYVCRKTEERTMREENVFVCADWSLKDMLLCAGNFEERCEMSDSKVMFVVHFAEEQVVRGELCGEEFVAPSDSMLYSKGGQVQKVWLREKDKSGEICDVEKEIHHTLRIRRFMDMSELVLHSDGEGPVVLARAGQVGNFYLTDAEEVATAMLHAYQMGRVFGSNAMTKISRGKLFEDMAVQAVTELLPPLSEVFPMGGEIRYHMYMAFDRGLNEIINEYRGRLAVVAAQALKV